MIVQCEVAPFRSLCLFFIFFFFKQLVFHWLFLVSHKNRFIHKKKKKKKNLICSPNYSKVMFLKFHWEYYKNNRKTVLITLSIPNRRFFFWAVFFYLFYFSELRQSLDLIPVSVNFVVVVVFSFFLSPPHSFPPFWNRKNTTHTGNTIHRLETPLKRDFPWWFSYFFFFKWGKGDPEKKGVWEEADVWCIR